MFNLSGNFTFLFADSQENLLEIGFELSDFGHLGKLPELRALQGHSLESSQRVVVSNRRRKIKKGLVKVYLTLIGFNIRRQVL